MRYGSPSAAPATASRHYAAKSCSTSPPTRTQNRTRSTARIGRPRHTVRRELEALHMLRLLQCEETDEENDKGKVVRTIYEYSLANAFDRATLLAMTQPRKTQPQKED
jgi:hypothetical protein